MICNQFEVYFNKWLLWLNTAHYFCLICFSVLRLIHWRIVLWEAVLNFRQVQLDAQKRLWLLFYYDSICSQLLSGRRMSLLIRLEDEIVRKQVDLRWPSMVGFSNVRSIWRVIASLLTSEYLLQDWWQHLRLRNWLGQQSKKKKTTEYPMAREHLIAVCIRSLNWIKLYLFGAYMRKSLNRGWVILYQWNTMVEWCFICFFIYWKHLMVDVSTYCVFYYSIKHRPVTGCKWVGDSSTVAISLEGIPAVLMIRQWQVASALFPSISRLCDGLFFCDSDLLCCTMASCFSSCLEATGETGQAPGFEAPVNEPWIVPE